MFVDEIPDRSELRLEHENVIWCDIDNRYANFFAWSGAGNDGGFSGRCFENTTIEGEQVTVRGPWSSPAGGGNQRSFGPVVDVRLATDPAVLDRGYTFRSGTLTLPAAKQALDLAADASHLKGVEKFDADEPYWVPVKTNGGCGVMKLYR